MAEVGNAVAAEQQQWKPPPGWDVPGGPTGVHGDPGPQGRTGGGPSKVADAAPAQVRSGTLLDGTRWQETTNPDGTVTRTEAMDDGRTRTEVHDASGALVEQTHSYPDGSGRTVRTAPDGSTTTVRRAADGSTTVEVTDPDGSSYERRYAPDGEHTASVERWDDTVLHRDGTGAHQWSTVPESGFGDPIDPAGTLDPNDEVRAPDLPKPSEEVELVHPIDDPAAVPEPRAPGSTTAAPRPGVGTARDPDLDRPVLSADEVVAEHAELSDALDTLIDDAARAAEEGPVQLSPPDLTVPEAPPSVHEYMGGDDKIVPS
jgi:hypothetical protein